MTDRLCQACGYEWAAVGSPFCESCETEIRAEAEDYEQFVLAQRPQSSDIPGELA